jgi:hypothetical protein
MFDPIIHKYSVFVFRKVNEEEEEFKKYVAFDERE